MTYCGWLIDYFLDETFSIRVNSVPFFAPAMSWISDLTAVARGLQRVNRAFLCQRQDELKSFWSNSSLRPVVRSVCDQCEDVFSNVMLRSSSTTVCYVLNCAVLYSRQNTSNWVTVLGLIVDILFVADITVHFGTLMCLTLHVIYFWSFSHL